MNENMQKIIANSKLCPIRKEDRRQLLSSEEFSKYMEDVKNNQKEIKEDINSANSENCLRLVFIKVDGEMDLSSADADTITFDDRTNLSNKAFLPVGFNPTHFKEQGKDYGLNLKSLHEKGITGKGVKIAIIDQSLSDHEEYHNKILHYEEIYPNPYAKHFGAMHGSAVTSLAVGTNCGVAPDAEVYYFAVPFHDFKNDVPDRTYVMEALKKCIEINKKLPVNERISAVSISAELNSSIQGCEKIDEYLKEAKDVGLEVIYCDMFKKRGLSMNGYNRDMNKDVNDEANIIPIANLIDGRMSQDWFDKDKSKTVLIPCDHRTMASEKGYNEYMHTARGGFSWLPPQVTGLYALARQVDRSCTLEHMWSTMLKTGIKTEQGIAVAPVRMVEALEQEKLNTQKKIMDFNNNYQSKNH